MTWNLARASEVERTELAFCLFRIYLVQNEIAKMYSLSRHLLVLSLVNLDSGNG